MAGHSKYANIKHRKSAQDAKRGKLFTKLIREITVAAKMGGEDVSANPRLRTAIDKALSNNMTRDTIDRAIKRGVGSGETDNMEEIRYEGYGPGGVAIMVDCLSDNRNRTVSDVRHAFTKFGGNLGTDGSVSYLFTQQGLISFAKGADEERILEVALDAGATDVTTNDDGSIDVLTAPDQFQRIKEAMDAAQLKSENGEVTMIASVEVDLDEDTSKSLVKLLDMLDDSDDVQNVYTNANIDEKYFE